MTANKMIEGPYIVMDGNSLVYFGPLDGAFPAFNNARKQYTKAESSRVRLYECAIVLDGQESVDKTVTIL